MTAKFLSIILFFTFMFSTAVNAAPMAFSINKGTKGCQGCMIIEANGSFTEATASEFTQFIKKNPELKTKDTTVVFNSFGGSLSSGIKVGELIRDHQFNTHIAKVKTEILSYKLSDGVCASACAYAFLGGLRRSTEGSSKYGVHQVSVNSSVSVSLNKAVRSTQNTISFITNYVENMGASSQVVVLATKTSDRSIHWVEPNQLNAMNIINSRGLARQENWGKVQGFNNAWSIQSLVSNGDRDSQLVTCSEVPNPAGSVTLIISPSKTLPKNHALVNGIGRAKIDFVTNGISAGIVQDETIFFTDEHSLSIDVPARFIRRALDKRYSLAVKVDYEDDFSNRYFPTYHRIPPNGMREALEGLEVICRHIKG